MNDAKLLKRLQKKQDQNDFNGYVGVLVQLKGGVCEKCGKPVEFNYGSGRNGGCVHHASRNKWDLVVLCPECHRKEHQ